MERLDGRQNNALPIPDASPHLEPARDVMRGESDRSDGGKEKEKRTRRRFTTAQLTLLEQLYHRSSHPTREQREQLAAIYDIVLPLSLAGLGSGDLGGLVQHA